MIMFIGNKKYKFSDLDLEYMYEAEGNEACVYRYKDKALKIYKDFSRKDRLSEKDVERLSKISTNRILLSVESIHNATNKFLGYVLKYIERYSHSLIPNVNMIKFLDELNLIYEDLCLLSNNHVDVEDFIMDNLLFDGNIYITDPGSYIFRDDVSVEKLKHENILKLNHFIVNELMTYNVSISKKNKEKLADHFLDSELFVGEVMKNEINSKDTVSSYVKRLVR